MLTVVSTFWILCRMPCALSHSPPAISRQASAIRLQSTGVSHQASATRNQALGLWRRAACPMPYALCVVPCALSLMPHAKYRVREQSAAAERAKSPNRMPYAACVYITVINFKTLRTFNSRSVAPLPPRHHIIERTFIQSLILIAAVILINKIQHAIRNTQLFNVRISLK